MTKLKSLGELEALRKSIIQKRDPSKTCITICNGTGCQAYGCKSVTAAFRKRLNGKTWQQRWISKLLVALGSVRGVLW